MMIQHFNTLSKQDQQNSLLKEGIFLAEREDGPFRIMLYQLDSFYVEVYFFNLYNKVAFLQSFTDTDALEPYLEQLNVTSMLNEVLH
jgi:hypothetical protein